ncbi:MAG: HU family DNA-binding protein [Alphaproteobacteria bacterium]|nr:HU family DNA-binding protein [Alphaproteobacteria bacterium]
MNKTEFAQKLAKKAGVSQAKALEIVDIIFSAKSGEGIIAVELDAGRKVTIPGFGTFGTKSRAARSGRNPSTGAVIPISAKKYAYFKPGKTLRERVSD